MIVGGLLLYNVSTLIITYAQHVCVYLGSTMHRSSRCCHLIFVIRTVILLIYRDRLRAAAAARNSEFGKHILTQLA